MLYSFESPLIYIHKSRVRSGLPSELIGNTLSTPHIEIFLCVQRVFTTRSTTLLYMAVIQ